MSYRLPSSKFSIKQVRTLKSIQQSMRACEREEKIILDISTDDQFSFTKIFMKFLKTKELKRKQILKF